MFNTTVLAQPDPLTGFGGHDKLLADLDVAVAPTSTVQTFVLFDLGGFSEYRDHYGRVESEQLLRTLAGRLAEALGDDANCYRPRQDEFAALLDAPISATEPVIAETVSALNERFTLYNLSLSFGALTLPEAAADPIEALILADEQLAINSGSRRARERRANPR